MQIFFQSREAARKATFGKMVDNGPNAPKGKRYARQLTAVSGNSSQRRKMVRQYTLLQAA